VAHDLSLLMPEIWSRLSPQERDARNLIEKGLLTKVVNFRSGRKTVEARRLGYRINQGFLHAYFGRLFSDPTAVFPEDMLRPEKQNLRDFVAGVENIVAGQRKAAKVYFEDGSVKVACPPLKTLLHIMVHGEYDGLTLDATEFRALFTRESLFRSDWYGERLERQQRRDSALWQGRIDRLREFLALPYNRAAAKSLRLSKRLAFAEKNLREAKQPGYVKKLIGTLGADAVGIA
jgi:hypothetical protein